MYICATYKQVEAIAGLDLELVQARLGLLDAARAQAARSRHHLVQIGVVHLHRVVLRAREKRNDTIAVAYSITIYMYDLNKNIYK